MQPQQLDLQAAEGRLEGGVGPWGLCVGRRFPQEAYNYKGSFSPCCVAFNRQSGVGAPNQTQHVGG